MTSALSKASKEGRRICSGKEKGEEGYLKVQIVLELVSKQVNDTEKYGQDQIEGRTKEKGLFDAVMGTGLLDSTGQNRRDQTHR